MLINTISLQEAKASSAIENILTTDDELYKAYSEQKWPVERPPSHTKHEKQAKKPVFRLVGGAAEN